MKNIFFTIIILGLIININSQQNNKIGISTGIVSYLYNPHKIGLASTVNYTRVISDKIDLLATTGFMIWGYDRSDIYNIYVIPVLIGAKYKFNFNGFKPFVLIQGGKLFGKQIETYNWTVGSNSDIKDLSLTHKDINGLAVFGGLGFTSELSERLDFEFSAIVELAAEDKIITNTFNGRIMLGINYSF